MNQTHILVTFLSLFLILHTTNSLAVESKSSLVKFLAKLSNTNGQLDSVWNSTSDPCKDQWMGVTCDIQTNNSVRKLDLNNLNLSGSFDISSLCNIQYVAASLTVVNLEGNNIGGEISAEIANCEKLASLQVSGNNISGNLPDSLSSLNNLKILDISNNKFSGFLPDLSRISGLSVFLAQYNQFTGNIATFDFSHLEQFNVSYNNFSGSIPDTNGRFTESSFLGNPKLCGDQLPNKCPSANSEAEKSNSDPKDLKKQILLYSGYAVIGLIFIAFIIYWLHKGKKKGEKVESPKRVASFDDIISITKSVAESSEYRAGDSKSEFFVASADQSALVSSSLVVLTSPVVNGLKFDDLLKAPAELLGRGKHGTLYKIALENGVLLVVKRIKGWEISSNDFKLRMQRLHQEKHPNVLPALAFYCNKEEKLLVYEHQRNGSLFRLLHGTQIGQSFDWASRLCIASSVAEALAFMHQEFRDEGIAHGNLKSSNILLDQDMEPRISEYGLMPSDNQPSSSSASNAFGADVYGFGVILLELLTGKLVQNEGVDLATWVNSVVREEWTVEVFDRSLISEGASEERMVNLLQVAVKCVNRLPEARPNMNQVAVKINGIKEEEEKSVISEV